MKNHYILLSIFLLLNFSGCGPEKQSFDSVVDCTAACQNNDFDQGTCVMPYETSRDMVNIGQCTIEDNQKCQGENQCQCYCFDNNMISEQLDIITRNNN